MAAEVASLSVVIRGDTEDAEKKIKGVNDHVKESGGFFKNALSNALGFASGAAIVSGVGAAVGFVASNLGDMVKQGMDGNRSMAILAQGLKSTHDASGMTVDSLDALSTKIMNLTGIDDDSTKAAEQMLLTFTGIGKQAFPAATQAAADMATRMNGGAIPSAQQMQQQALLLGKALNDPAKGMTALTREGVTFTDKQKEQITAMEKAGNTAGAQKIILAELSKEFGGSAEAAGKANGGIGILAAQFDNLKQTAGQALIPAISGVTAAISPLLASAGAALPGALKTLGDVLGPIIDMIKWAAQEFLTHLQPGLASVTTAFSGLGKSFNGIAWSDVLEPVGQLAGTLGGALSTALQGVAALLKNIDWLAVGTAVGTFAAAINNALTMVGNFINFIATHQAALDALEAVLAGVAAAVLTALIPAAIALVPAFIGWAVAAGAAAIATIAATWPLLAIGAGIALLILGVKLLISHWGDIQKFFQGIGQAVADAVGKVLAWFGQLKDKAIAIVQNAFNLIKTTIENDLNAAKQIVQNIINGVLNIFKWLYEHNTYFKFMVDGIKADIKIAHDVITTVVNAIRSFISTAFNLIKQVALNDWNLIQQYIIQPVQAAFNFVRGAISAAGSWIAGQWNNIVGAAQGAWNRFTGAISAAIGAARTAIGNVLDAITKPINDLGTTLFNAGKNLIQLLINGISNMAGALGNAIHSVIKNALAGLGFVNIPGFAGGTDNAPGGLAIVGEHGPELVALPPGSRVYSASETANLMRPAASASASSGGGGGGGTQHIIIQLDGRTIARTTVEHMPAIVRLATGNRNA